MNAFLGIDIFNGSCFFTSDKQSDSAIVAQYFADMAEKYEATGTTRLAIFLDNNPTHKEKMQTLFRELTNNLTIETTFHFIATYSPKLNLVEYGIHKIRQQVLHHADCKLDLVALETRIRTLCTEGVFTAEQIMNLLTHIRSLVIIE